MGRRKSSRKPEARKKNIEPLDTQFTCPFCNHEKACEVSPLPSFTGMPLEAVNCLLHNFVCFSVFEN